jgi:hypothetical protein
VSLESFEIHKPEIFPGTRVTRADKEERRDLMSPEDWGNDGGSVTETIIKTEENPYLGECFTSFADAVVRHEITVLLQEENMALQNGLIHAAIVASARNPVIEKYDRRARGEHSQHWQAVREREEGCCNLAQSSHAR